MWTYLPRIITYHQSLSTFLPKKNVSKKSFNSPSVENQIPKNSKDVGILNKKDVGIPKKIDIDISQNKDVDIPSKNKKLIFSPCQRFSKQLSKQSFHSSTVKDHVLTNNKVVGIPKRKDVSIPKTKLSTYLKMELSSYLQSMSTYLHPKQTHQTVNRVQCTIYKTLSEE